MILAWEGERRTLRLWIESIRRRRSWSGCRRTGGSREILVFTRVEFLHLCVLYVISEHCAWWWILLIDSASASLCSWLSSSSCGCSTQPHYFLMPLCLFLASSTSAPIPPFFILSTDPPIAVARTSKNQRHGLPSTNSPVESTPYPQPLHPSASSFPPCPMRPGLRQWPVPRWVPWRRFPGGRCRRRCELRLWCVGRARGRGEGIGRGWTWVLLSGWIGVSTE